MPTKDNVVLNLVESNILSSWVADRPDLGCAMLIAACQNKNIKVKLIKGQTRHIKDMFLNDGDEFWELINDLKEPALRELGLRDYKIYIHKKGKAHFKQELEDIYKKIFTNKEPRNFLNAGLLNKFKISYARFVVLYGYYICKRRCYDIAFFKRYISEILGNKPDYIGFSLGADFDPVSRAIRMHIKKLTRLPIIAGGSLTSFMGDENLSAVFLKECIDYLIIGPGEYALPNLIEALNDKKEPSGVANVFYKKGNFVKTNVLETITKLDALPFPDFSQFDLDLYFNPGKVLPVQDARGCSWRKCAFCDYRRNYFGTYSTFSIDRVIQIIRYLKDTYNCQYFVFHNDDLPPGRARKISRAIIKHKIKNIYFKTYARLVDGFNERLLRLIRKAGFCCIIWGLESGSQKILDLMNKGIKIEIASRILRDCKKNEIANICAVIFDFPGESLEDMQTTIDFLKERAGCIAAVSDQQFKLAEGSPIYKNYIKSKKTYWKESKKNKESRMVQCRLYLERIIGAVELACNARYNDLLLWHFYIASWEPLSEKKIMSYLHKKRFDKIFPLIPGRLKKIKNKVVFYPVNIRETDFINQILPPEEIILDRIEEKMVYFSDGYRSLKEILAELNGSFSEKYADRFILNKSVDFFKKTYKMNMVMNYARPLNT